MSESELSPMLPLVSPPELDTRWWSCYSCRRNSLAIDCHCAVDLRLVRVAWLRVELWMPVVLGQITTATPCTSSRSSLVGRNSLAISRPAPTSWRRSRQSPRTPGRRMWDRPTYKYGDIWVPTHDNNLPILVNKIDIQVHAVFSLLSRNRCYNIDYKRSTLSCLDYNEKTMMLELLRISWVSAD